VASASQHQRGDVVGAEPLQDPDLAVLLGPDEHAGEDRPPVGLAVEPVHHHDRPVDRRAPGHHHDAGVGG
jgi:hypothetical protein